MVIETDQCGFVTDELEIANSFNEKIVEMNIFFLDSPQDILLETQNK